MPRDPVRPSSLADALKAFVAHAPQLAARLEAATAVDAWADAVGPQIAAVARARSVSADGVLFVDVTTNAWMTELQMMERELLARLNGPDGPARVRKIRWTLARK